VGRVDERKAPIALLYRGSKGLRLVPTLGGGLFRGGPICSDVHVQPFDTTYHTRSSSSAASLFLPKLTMDLEFEMQWPAKACADLAQVSPWCFGTLRVYVLMLCSV
jgi:hypothetical protein